MLLTPNLGGLGKACSIAERRNAIAVIDEKRARSFLPQTQLASTVDILAHPSAETTLGSVGHARAVYNALKNSRMSARMDQRDWLVNKIGLERAGNCNSLPGFKEVQRRAFEPSQKRAAGARGR